MKTYSLLGILLYFFCAVSFISCDKDDSERSEDSTVYYVKYEAKGATQTYGPVSKGFRASITAKGGWATVNIYVCKGDEPFALKKSKSNNVGNSNTSTSASYTIDY